jgi:hypothetical protein
MKESVGSTQGVESAVQRLDAAFARIQGLVGGFRV